MKGMLRSALRVLIHTAINIFIQAILWSMIIWYYDLSIRYYAMSCTLMAVCIVLDLLVCKIFKAYPMGMLHLAGLLFILPSFIFVIIQVIQGGIRPEAIVVGTLDVIVAVEKGFLAIGK